MSGGSVGMLGRRGIDSNPKRFWTWFAAEAQGVANALEALSRGEADAEWMIAGLNDRIKRVDSTLEADVSRSADGHCCLTLSGADAAVDAVLNSAPDLRGWRIAPRATAPAKQRLPFLRVPLPSLDVLASPITARYEAYAVLP